MKKKLLAVYCVLLSTGIYAQPTPLPYSTGFDNAAQQAGWVEYRKGTISVYDWATSAFVSNTPSAPNCITHDYYVGGGAPGKVVDWYVSPEFDFSTGGKIDALKLNLFAWMLDAPNDHLGVYLLNGSKDPAIATASLLKDLTAEWVSTDTWKTISNISIPATTGKSYIAFKYTALDNWFVPNIDDISISAVAGSACGATSNILFSNVTSSGAKLTWSAVTGATAYEYTATTSATPPASGTASTQLSETVTGLSSHTTYYAHVRAKCGTSFSPWTSKSFFTSFPAGINSNGLQEGASIYPNPATDKLFTEGINGKAYVSVRDLAGKMISHEEIADLKAGIPVAHLPAGTYILTIMQGNKTITARFSK